jgi:sulfofructose kinase
MRPIDILGLGGVAVDDFIFVETYPPADAKARVQRRERHCGGLTGTALVAGARLGAQCAYAGVLGHDELSTFALDCLRKDGVDISHVRQTATARPIYSTIVVDETRGTRNIFYDLNQVIGASERSPAAAVIRASKVLLVDNIGVPGMLRAAHIAHAAGIPVVADFDGAQDPRFAELLALVDHLIVSQTFAQKHTGARSPERAARMLSDRDHQVVVVTCGAKGAWFLERGWTVPKHLPAFKVEVTDTTGCGDVFHGAYAAGLASGMDLSERIRLASAAAALKATKPGGQAGIPNRTEVANFLKS